MRRLPASDVREKEMIRLLNDQGPVDGAVFDAVQISPDFAGIRCGISIGSNGGVVCDAIECERPFRPSIIREVATEAVVLLDKSRFEGEPEFVLIDADGRTVDVDGEEDVHDPLDMELSAADDARIAELRERLPIPWALILSIVAILGAGGWMRYVGRDIEEMRWGFLILCLFGAFAMYNVIGAIRAKRAHDALTDEMEILIERELERRRALDKAMERHGSERATRAAAPAAV